MTFCGFMYPRKRPEDLVASDVALLVVGVLTLRLHVVEYDALSVASVFRALAAEGLWRNSRGFDGVITFRLCMFLDFVAPP